MQRGKTEYYLKPVNLFAVNISGLSFDCFLHLNSSFVVSYASESPRHIINLSIAKASARGTLFTIIPVVDHLSNSQSASRFSKLRSGLLTLNAPIATKVVCFSRLLKCLRSLCGKQCGPRSDCSYRSSLFWVHTVCFYT